VKEKIIKGEIGGMEIINSELECLHCLEWSNSIEWFFEIKANGGQTNTCPVCKKQNHSEWPRLKTILKHTLEGVPQKKGEV
jgi:hypothetical protein